MNLDPPRHHAPFSNHAIEVLGAVEVYQQDNGYPPTRQDIAEMTGLDRKVVEYHLNLLRDAGMVDWKFNSPRSIRLVEED
jgi:DNA-binding transcriptional regulator LsrR (DeoR family)